MKKKDITLIIVILVFLAIFIILSGLVYKTQQAYSASEDFLKSILKIQQNNEDSVFTIDQISYFSSSDANIETNSNSSFTITGLYQYTDIAFFINPNSDTLTAKNTLKSVVIDDFNYIDKPNIGTQNLYYKNIHDYATSRYNSEDLIKDSITFKTTSESTMDYSTPLLYNNCANPITLCYINSGLNNSYTLADNVSNLHRNGSLLKTCGITLSSLSCKLSFRVTITNNLDEIYTCPISLNIPLSSENTTIYNGNMVLKDNVNYKFIKIANE